MRPWCVVELREGWPSAREVMRMPRNDPKDLCPPAQYRPRRMARPLSVAEIKAAADRAEARSKLSANSQFGPLLVSTANDIERAPSNPSSRT